MVLAVDKSTERRTERGNEDAQRYKRRGQNNKQMPGELRIITRHIYFSKHSPIADRLRLHGFVHLLHLIFCAAAGHLLFQTCR